MAAMKAGTYEVVIERSHGLSGFDWAELWSYRDLLLALVQRDITSRYKQTLLGPLWYVAQPLLTTLIFVIIFARVAQIPTDGIPAPVFYLCGLLPWNYFATNVTSGASTFMNNSHLFSKVYFPRLILPGAVVAANLFTFFVQLVPFVVLVAYFKFFTTSGAALQISWNALLAIPLLLQAALLSLGIGLCMSAATAKYRDLVHLNQFVIQLWMFATPVIYPLSKVPARYAWLTWLNPIAAVVEGFRIALLGHGTVPPSTMLASVALTIVILLVGIASFQKATKTAVDNL